MFFDLYANFMIGCMFLSLQTHSFTPSSIHSNLNIHNLQPSKTYHKGQQSFTSRSILFANSIHIEPNISIEYCTGCRWLFRSSWLMQELLTTFESEMGSVSLIPCKGAAGTFLVKFNNDVTLWDRKADGGFPESKQLKQRVRDYISPDKDLGHSDVNKSESNKSEERCVECEENEKNANSKDNDRNEGVNTIKEVQSKQDTDQISNHIKISYCTNMNWLIRATFMCQELLSVFQDELISITLEPHRSIDKPGVFVSSLNKYLLNPFAIHTSHVSFPVHR